MEDPRQAPLDRQVTSLGYCGGQCTIDFVDGSSRKIGERDVRFATDSSPLEPGAGRPGMLGSRWG